MAKLAAFADQFSYADSVTWSGFGTAFTVVAPGYLSAVSESGYPSLSTGSNHDATASMMTWEFVQAPGVGNGTIQLFMGFQPSAGNSFTWMHNGTTMAAVRKISNVDTTVASETYSTTNHRWLRISEAGGVITWSKSADGLNWTSLGTYNHALDVTASAVVVVAGYFGTETPTAGLIDNLNVAPVGPAWVADRGTTANVTAATTQSHTIGSPTVIAVGNYLVARVAVDNSGSSGAAPGCTVTDPRSNTWTVLGPGLSDPGAVNAGSTAYLCYARVATAYQAADALTFNWGGISTAAKAIVVEEWSGIHPTNPVAVTAVTNNSVSAGSTTAVTATIVPTNATQLVYTCLSTEGIAGDSITYDADTTNGVWSTLTRVASADATATNNQCVAGQYKVVNASGSQTWNATITSRDWGAVAVVFAGTPAPPLLRPSRRRLNIGALLDL